jgi:probable HAF family extracellular repeat protein
MKLRRLTYITAFTLLSTLVLPGQMAAQHRRYKLIDLGTLGGPNSFVEVAGDLPVVLNNEGTVVGCADTSAADPRFPDFSPLLNPPAPDPFIFHSFQWQKGAMTDLGALPGDNSSCATWISRNGLITGMSSTRTFDPALGGIAAHAVFWREGEIIDIGTFGGAESLALGVNDRGQVAGSATNTIADSVSGFGTQLRAFRWQNGVMQDLGTLGGPDAFATSINESGQVAGCANTDSVNQNAFLWDNGEMIDLGSFGGTYACAFQVNNHGQVMGLSTLPGDQVQRAFFGDQRGITDLGNFGGSEVEPFWLNERGEVVGKATYVGDEIAHAFLWKQGVLKDLGTVYPGCSTSGSVGLGMNSREQIVGNSWCDEMAAAFLWQQGGPMIDLNTLIPADSAMYLFGAQNINDRGEISGLGFLPETGEIHGFLLIPCGEGSASCQKETENPTGAARARVVVPETVRVIVRQRHHPFHILNLRKPRK